MVGGVLWYLLIFDRTKKDPMLLHRILFLEGVRQDVAPAGRVCTSIYIKKPAWLIVGGSLQVGYRPAGSMKSFICLFFILWFIEYLLTVFRLWETCEKMVNIFWESKKDYLECYRLMYWNQMTGVSQSPNSSATFVRYYIFSRSFQTPS